MIRYRVEVDEDGDIRRSLRVGPLVIVWFTCRSEGGGSAQAWWRPHTPAARCLWMREWSAPVRVGRAP